MSINSINVAEPIKLGCLEEVHTDARRAIFECNLPTSSVQEFSIYKAIPLGNHFHKKKQETFLVTKGIGKFAYLPLTAEEEPDGEQVTVNVEQGSVIQVLPFTAHTFRLEPGSAMICFSTEPFDSENLDMFSYPLDI